MTIDRTPVELSPTPTEMGPSATEPVIGIVGGGLAGTLVAANLLRRSRGALRIVIVERSGDFGPGVAYSTRDDQHLLNVCAARMSAFCDAPLHFLTWARKRLGEVDAGAYLPRRVYGEYLRELLDDEARLAPGGATLERVTGDVQRLARREDGRVELALAGGASVRCDRAVLAVGSPPGAAPCELPEDPRIVGDPWVEGALDELTPDARCLLIGTSLTAVDVALTLAERAPRGRTVAISRRGLVPFAHLPGLREPAPDPVIGPEVTTLEELEEAIRAHVELMAAEGYDWREVVDGIRPHVPRLWSRLTLDARRRFLRDRVREWDVRRHRIAPEVGRSFDALRSAGRLAVRAGSIGRVRACEQAIEVDVVGEHGGQTLTVDAVISCAGAGTDMAAHPDPLIRGLLADRVAVSDELAVGVRAGRCGRLIGAEGRACEDVYVLGPLRRGELWETVAAREIRIQAEDIAAELSEGLGASMPRGRGGLRPGRSLG